MDVLCQVMFAKHPKTRQLQLARYSIVVRLGENSPGQDKYSVQSASRVG